MRHAGFWSAAKAARLSKICRFWRAVGLNLGISSLAAVLLISTFYYLVRNLLYFFNLYQINFIRLLAR